MNFAELCWLICSSYFDHCRRGLEQDPRIPPGAPIANRMPIQANSLHVRDIRAAVSLAKIWMSWGSLSGLVLRSNIPGHVIRGSFSAQGLELILCVDQEKKRGFPPPLTCIVRNFKASNCSLYWTTGFLHTTALRHSDMSMPAKLAHLLVYIPENLGYLSITKHLTKMLVPC